MPMRSSMAKHCYLAATTLFVAVCSRQIQTCVGWTPPANSKISHNVHKGQLSKAETPTTTSIHTSIHIPLQKSVNEKEVQNLQDAAFDAFDEMVQSTDFWDPVERGVATIPMLGSATVSLSLVNDPSQQQQQQQGDDEPYFVLSFTQQTAANKKDQLEDFGWVCAKFNECRSLFEHVMDMSVLDGRMIQHQQTLQRSFPGSDAADARLAGSKDVADLFGPTTLQELKQNGWVVIDTNIMTSSSARDKLSKLMSTKSSQDKDVRRDATKFLDRADAQQCDLECNYDILMGIASFLNDNYSFDGTEWPFPPRFPATNEQPLTNPRYIQAAEYRENEFYITHRDNIYMEDAQRRSNLRHVTCILYCNDDWKEEDGGALRLYPGTTFTPMEDTHTLNYVDILPENGRLLIFESMLLHSVEKLTHPTKKRQALTCWINRPDESTLEA